MSKRKLALAILITLALFTFGAVCMCYPVVLAGAAGIALAVWCVREIYRKL